MTFAQRLLLLPGRGHHPSRRVQERRSRAVGGCGGRDDDHRACSRRTTFPRASTSRRTGRSTSPTGATREKRATRPGPRSAPCSRSAANGGNSVVTRGFATRSRCAARRTTTSASSRSWRRTARAAREGARRSWWSGRATTGASPAARPPTCRTRAWSSRTRARSVKASDCASVTPENVSFEIGHTPFGIDFETGQVARTVGQSRVRRAARRRRLVRRLARRRDRARPDDGSAAPVERPRVGHVATSPT